MRQHRSFKINMSTRHVDLSFITDEIASREKVASYKMMKQKAYEEMKRWTEGWFINDTQKWLLRN